MAGSGIVFQQVQDIPAAGIGQVEVQNDGRWRVASDQGQSGVAVRSNETLEALFVGKVIDDFGKFRIIFNDQQDFVTLVQLGPVIRKGDELGSWGDGDLGIWGAGLEGCVWPLLPGASVLWRLCASWLFGLSVDG